MNQPSPTRRTTGTSRTRRWPWWLRSPHSRLFSEWIELKTDQHSEEPRANGDAEASAA
jgi:hypothetical protein